MIPKCTIVRPYVVRRPRIAFGLSVLLAAIASSLVMAVTASAAPTFEAELITPTHVAPGSSYLSFLSLRNASDDDTTGQVTATIDLPPEVSPSFAFGGAWNCELQDADPEVTCTLEPDGGEAAVPAKRFLTSSIFLVASVDSDASGTVSTTGTFSGGGAAAPASATERTTVTATRPDFGIYEFSGEILKSADGDPLRQAGARPHAFRMTTRFNSPQPPDGIFPVTTPPAHVKTLEMDLPRGLIGDPTAIPQCQRAQFEEFQCPNSTVVGYVKSQTQALANHNVAPVFNLVPPDGAPAQFASVVGGVIKVIANVSLRPDGDYRVTVTIRNLLSPSVGGVIKTDMTLWGVPSDPTHNDLRGACLTDPGPCIVDPVAKPFLTMPTDCSSGPMQTVMRADSWTTPGVFEQASFDEDRLGSPLQVSGCDAVPFSPVIHVNPLNPSPDSPSGYEIELSVPQRTTVTSLATSHLKKAVVMLPEGVSISPAAAHGLKACSPAEIGLGTSAPPTCPDASKVGTLSVDTPLLEEPLIGEVYVASQKDNPFGSTFAMYVVARGPGIMVKLPGRLDANPVTGQLEARFDNNPQLPFSRLRISLKGGPAAVLANPSTCGEKSATAHLSPWARPNESVVATDSFTIECAGPAGFAPSFDAGTLMPSGGSFSPFVLRLNRQDGHQHLRGVALEMPPGLIAKLKGVQLCPDAQAYAGTCGLESRVGTATVGAGPGPNPFFLTGSVYLTGPYTPNSATVFPTLGAARAPYGLVVVVPAVAGPFDLGTVVVRQAIFIDPTDAHLTVISDPLPTILEGIPLRLRSVNVDIGRPGFVLNPTSCAEKQIKGTLVSTEGTVAPVTQRFQASDCQALPFKPKLALRFTGRKQIKDGGHPGLRAVMTQKAGQANLKKVAVELPLSVALDPDNAQALCEYDDGQRVDCPKASMIGRARAISPILNRPLTGPVYFVKGVRFTKTGERRRTLPTLLIPLRGEVDIDLRAKSSVRRGALVSTFEAIPDAPVSRFNLRLKGGKHGILVVTGGRNLCKGNQIADAEIDGQNGKRADQAVKFKTPCKKAKKKSRRHGGRRG